MFIKRLNELCKETGVSRYKLSKETGIGDSTMYGWDKGQQPSADKLLKLADYFQVTTDYLLGRENELGIVNTNANLTPFQNKFFTVLNKLSEQDQYQVLGFAQSLAR